jgi:hypothetical protein
MIIIPFFDSCSHYSAIAMQLDYMYNEDVDGFHAYVQEKLNDKRLLNLIWDFLSDNVKTELTKLGYTQENHN